MSGDDENMLIKGQKPASQLRCGNTAQKLHLENVFSECNLVQFVHAAVSSMTF